MSESEQDGEAITADGIKELDARIEELEGPEREKIAARLKTARELGDLKENAEYHIAKEDQAHLETTIKRLRERRLNAVVIEVADGPAANFGFGRTAEITDDAGRTHTWTLVGSTEANLAEGRLSAESPIGQALRDKPVGVDVTVTTPKGPRVFRIERLD